MILIAYPVDGVLRAGVYSDRREADRVYASLLSTGAPITIGPTTEGNIDSDIKLLCDLHDCRAHLITWSEQGEQNASDLCNDSRRSSVGAPNRRTT